MTLSLLGLLVHPDTFLWEGNHLPTSFHLNKNKQKKSIKKRSIKNQQKNACHQDSSFPKMLSAIEKKMADRRHLGGRIQSLMSSLRSLRRWGFGEMRCGSRLCSFTKDLGWFGGFLLIFIDLYWCFMLVIHIHRLIRIDTYWQVFSIKLHGVISLEGSRRQVTSCRHWIVFWCRSRCGHQTLDSPCEWMDACRIGLLVAHSNRSGFCQMTKWFRDFLGVSWAAAIFTVKRQGGVETHTGCATWLEKMRPRSCAIFNDFNAVVFQGAFVHFL